MKKSILVIALILQCIVLFSQVKHLQDDGRKIRIPIVFHILYDKEFISDSTILVELNDLNLAYSAKNDMSLLDKDFKHLVGNPNIEFYLLDKAFQVKGLKGIQRVSSNTNHNSLLHDPKNCLNVFVDIHDNASDILSDRVNLNYEDVGAHSNALIHETGHWLGLFHIYGQIGNSRWWRVLFGNNDDLIDDTPEQKGGTSICYDIEKCECPPRKIYYKGHKTMYNNFMDYNACRCMFSIGQATKMRINIIEAKKPLFEQSKGL